MKAITDWNKEDKRIGIAADHGGFELKKEIIADLTAKGYQVLDYGPTVFDPQDDYSDFGVGLCLRCRTFRRRGHRPPGDQGIEGGRRPDGHCAGIAQARLRLPHRVLGQCATPR